MLPKNKFAFILGLIAILGLPWYYYQGYKLRKNHRYTIATIYKTHWSLKSGKYADSKYVVEGIEYTCSADADALAGQELMGQRFVVEFHPPEPKIAELYLAAPVPDEVSSAPPEGWTKPPFTVPADVLE